MADSLGRLIAPLRSVDVKPLVVQAIANKTLTGEWSANGAIVKLALNNPYMTSADKLDDYVGNVRYAALRNLDYHFAHIEGEHMSELYSTYFINY